MSAADPFPRDRVGATFRRLPAYLKLSWRLAREPLLSKARKAAVAAAAAYLASPIDLVPGVIPVLGQLDDLAFALAAIRFALDGLSPTRRRAHLDAVGLTDNDLTTDLRTIGSTTAWILRMGGRTTIRATKLGLRTSARLATLSATTARRAGGGARARIAAARDARRRGPEPEPQT